MRFGALPFLSGERGGYGRNFSLLLVGGALASAIPLALSPVLTRLYSPAEMGAASLISTTIGVAAAVITGRYEIPIGFVSDDRDGAELARTAFFVTLVTVLITAIGMAVFAGPVRAWLRYDLLGAWIWLLPVGLAFQGTLQTATLWLNRKERFTDLVVAKASRSLANGILSLTLGVLVFGSGGLVVGTVTGLGIAAGYSAWRMMRQIRTLGVSWQPASPLGATLRKYAHYPLYNASTSLLDSLSLSAPVYFLVHFFSAEEAGAFSLCLMVFGAPTVLVMESVTQASLTPFASAIRRGEGVRTLLLSRLRGLALVALLALVPLTLAAPQIFTAGFGARWAGAGHMAQWVAWIFAIRLLVSPFSFILNVVGWNRRLAAWKIAYFLATVSVLYFTSQLRLESFLWGLLLNELLCYTAYGILIFQAAGPAGNTRLAGELTH